MYDCIVIILCHIAQRFVNRVAKLYFTRFGKVTKDADLKKLEKLFGENVQQ